jgi:hypothetical protein
MPMCYLCDRISVTHVIGPYHLEPAPTVATGGECFTAQGMDVVEHRLVHQSGCCSGGPCPSCGSGPGRTVRGTRTDDRRVYREYHSVWRSNSRTSSGSASPGHISPRWYGTWCSHSLSSSGFYAIPHPDEPHAYRSTSFALRPTAKGIPHPRRQHRRSRHQRSRSRSLGVAKSRNALSLAVRRRSWT